MLLKHLFLSQRLIIDARFNFNSNFFIFEKFPSFFVCGSGSVWRIIWIDAKAKLCSKLFHHHIKNISFSHCLLILLHHLLFHHHHLHFYYFLTFDNSFNVTLLLQERTKVVLFHVVKLVVLMLGVKFSMIFIFPIALLFFIWQFEKRTYLIFFFYNLLPSLSRIVHQLHVYRFQTNNLLESFSKRIIKHMKLVHFYEGNNEQRRKRREILQFRTDVDKRTIKNGMNSFLWKFIHTNNVFWFASLFGGKLKIISGAVGFDHCGR